MNLRTSDLQTLLDQKANTQVTYSKDDVDGKFTTLIGTSPPPAALDTLLEISAALNDDGLLATHLLTKIGDKAPIADPTFTGTATFATVKGHGRT